MRIARLDPEYRFLAWLWLGTSVAIIGVRKWIVVLSPMMPSCHFKALTGVPCPGCGSTRAVLHLLGGDFETGWAFNPLAFLAVVAFLAGGLLAPVWLLAPLPHVSLTAGQKKRLAIGVAVGLAVNWAWLIAHGI